MHAWILALDDNYGGNSYRSAEIHSCKINKTVPQSIHQLKLIIFKVSCDTSLLFCFVFFVAVVVVVDVVWFYFLVWFYLF